MSSKNLNANVPTVRGLQMLTCITASFIESVCRDHLLKRCVEVYFLYVGKKCRFSGIMVEGGFDESKWIVVERSFWDHVHINAARFRKRQKKLQETKNDFYSVFCNRNRSWITSTIQLCCRNKPKFTLQNFNKTPKLCFSL